MKNQLACLLSLCFFAPQVFSQTYQPVAVEGAHWVMFALTQNGPDHHTFVICGDTTINGTGYKKMYREQLTSQATAFQDFQPPYFSDAVTLIGAIRDDEAARQTYFFAFANDFFPTDTCEAFQDVLIHDFSKSAGDTLHSCLHSAEPAQPVVVDSIKLEFLFGQERKTWYSSHAFARLVEGMGTDIGPLWPLPFGFVPKYPQVLVDYFVEPPLTCPPLVLTDVHQKALLENLTASPNPVHETLFVKLPTELKGPLQLTVFDVLGNTVGQQSLPGQIAHLEMPVADLPRGSYFLALSSEGLVLAKLKFVKG